MAEWMDGGAVEFLAVEIEACLRFDEHRGQRTAVANEENTGNISRDKQASYELIK